MQHATAMLCTASKCENNKPCVKLYIVSVSEMWFVIWLCSTAGERACLEVGLEQRLQAALTLLLHEKRLLRALPPTQRPAHRAR